MIPSTVGFIVVINWAAYIASSV